MTEEGRKEKERGQEHTQWGEVGEGEAVCGVSVTCPGGVAWVECAAQGVGGWLGGGGGGAGQVCGVGVLWMDKLCMHSSILCIRLGEKCRE